MPTALVRRPGPLLVDGIVTHQEPQPIDLALAMRQWEAYVAALRDAGWDVAEVEPADDCPDAVFIEDAVVVFGDVAVVTRPGADSRRGEIAGAEAAARAAGLTIERIVAPATFDGGDVLKVGRTAYIGASARTSPDGIEQLRAILAPRGWDVVAVQVRSVLHLKSAVTALPDGTVVGHPDHVDDPAAFERFLPVPEPTGAHVVLLGGDRLLMASGAPETAALYRHLGYRPVEVDVSEFEKLDGCVTCLSVRIRDEHRAVQDDLATGR
jgi:dimethylargininase